MLCHAVAKIEKEHLLALSSFSDINGSFDFTDMISEKCVSQFRAFAQRHRLFEPQERILLAISGGIDSVAMGWLFHQAGQAFGVVHCNFKLRGEASDGDELFVRQLAGTWNADFHTASFETQQYADKEGVSTQMAARNLRYSFFESVKAQHGFDKIATAHHIDDAFETLLLNITHGTGFRGLMGIVPRKGHLIRPMLAFSREEIADLAEKMNMEWREDASNEKDDYERNKIRHHISPVLKVLNPSFSQTIKDTMERVWPSGRQVEAAVERWEKRFKRQENERTEIQLGELANEDHILLFESLKKQTGLNYRSFNQLVEAIAAGLPGKQFYTPGFAINLDRQRLIIQPLAVLEKITPIPIRKEDNEISLPQGRLLLSKLKMPVEIETTENVALLDMDKLAFPLEVRSWQQGDAFVPLGMRGQKKLSDFMIDSKIPVNLKSQVLVLVSSGQIAWVAGQRIDDRFKITEVTRTVYRMELC